MKQSISLLSAGLLLSVAVQANPLLPASSLDSSALLGANPNFSVGQPANYDNYMPLDTVASSGTPATRSPSTPPLPTVARASPLKWRSINDGTLLRNPTVWFDTNAIGDELTDVDTPDNGIPDGPGDGPLAIIPEPASLALFGLLCLGLISRRCKKQR